jgi:hypothetical protein
VKAARAGDHDAAARCELAVLAYHGGPPTIEQDAGARLRALHHDDVRLLREAYVKTE